MDVNAINGLNSVKSSIKLVISKKFGKKKNIIYHINKRAGMNNEPK
jgi:hypothetical protein